MKSKRRPAPICSSSIESMAAAVDDSSDSNSNLSPFNQTDLIKDILSRLPIKSIKRFESVSKLWYSLINSDDFISSNLRRTSRHPILLVHRYHNPTTSNFSICLIDSRTAIPRDIRVPFLSSVVRFPKIVGSCNGVVCLDISPCYATRFVLWNLSTRQFSLLPRPRISDSRKPIWMVATGFGHSEQTNDYKLVRIVNFQCKSDESHIVRAEVFSWNTGSWRLIDGRMTDETIGNCVTHEGQHAVSINGSFCWMANKFGDIALRKCIVCFDLATEEFRQIPIPDFAVGVCCKIIKFKESLALAAYAGPGRPTNRIELYVWEEIHSANRITNFWNKVHMVEPNFSGTPIGVYNETDLLIKRVDSHFVTLSFYDPFSNCFNNLPICSSDYTCEFFSYVDSLMPVTNADVEEEAEAKE